MSELLSELLEMHCCSRNSSFQDIKFQDLCQEYLNT